MIRTITTLASNRGYNWFSQSDCVPGIQHGHKKMNECLAENIALRTKSSTKDSSSAYYLLSCASCSLTSNEGAGGSVFIDCSSTGLSMDTAQEDSAFKDNLVMRSPVCCQSTYCETCQHWRLVNFCYTAPGCFLLTHHAFLSSLRLSCSPLLLLKQIEWMKENKDAFICFNWPNQINSSSKHDHSGVTKGFIHLFSNADGMHLTFLWR